MLNSTLALFFYLIRGSLVFIYSILETIYNDIRRSALGVKRKVLFKNYHNILLMRNRR